ncbi:MAG TPA: nuclear transport factor 2 family protein [Pyrinomonadaceae bacterium]|nr:nuclear transport factor 2 family protein [Pyrinomonadaceae bacterium]
MKSILAIATLFAMMSLCNLTDKTKPAPTPSPDTSSNAAADREAVLADLMKIEYEMTTASLKGDISTLAPYIADDYSGTGYDGKTQNKNDVLAATKPDKITKSWKISDAQLVSLDKDSAVLSYIQSQTARNGRTARARNTDTFVKRDGRWLLKSEQQTLMK